MTVHGHGSAGLQARTAGDCGQPVEYQPDGALDVASALLRRMSILNDRPDLLRKGKQRKSHFQQATRVKDRSAARRDISL